MHHYLTNLQHNKMGMQKFEMYAQLHESQRRFQRACDQLALLNNRLTALNRRYNNARIDDQKLFRYRLRMHVLVVEDVLSAYCNYACLKKNEVLDLRFKLYGEDPSDGETVFRSFSQNDDVSNDDDEQ